MLLNPPSPTLASRPLLFFLPGTRSLASPWLSPSLLQSLFTCHYSQRSLSTPWGLFPEKLEAGSVSILLIWLYSECLSPQSPSPHQERVVSCRPCSLWFFGPRPCAIWFQAARTHDSGELEWRTREGATPRSRRPELLQGTQQAKLPDSRGFPKGSHSSSIPCE